MQRQGGDGRAAAAPSRVHLTLARRCTYAVWALIAMLQQAAGEGLGCASRACAATAGPALQQQCGQPCSSSNRPWHALRQAHLAGRMPIHTLLCHALKMRGCLPGGVEGWGLPTSP